MAGGRKYLRAKMGLRIRWRSDETGDWNEAPLEDLSVAGARFLCGRESPPGIRIQTKISLMGESGGLELPAVISRCDQKPSSADWYAAIKFVRLNESQIEELVRMIHESERQGRLNRKSG